MAYLFPFGQELHPLTQEDRNPKKVFVLGVYASAVHARWIKDGRIISQAMAVASEPRIFWDGNEEEAREIIGRINIPDPLGRLEPASRSLNGPSAKVLDEDILAPLGFTRKDAWLCDLLPETRINQSQEKLLKTRYNPLISEYGLNEVTIPLRPDKFCDDDRAKEITAELEESKAALLVLLGDHPIAEYLCKVAKVPYKTLREYTELYGYGAITEAEIGGKTYKILPLTHPRQIGALGNHSRSWNELHANWEKSLKNA